MATVRIRVGGAMGGGAPALTPHPTFTAQFTSSASNQATTAVARAGDYARIASDGGAIRIAIGATPVAVADGGDWVRDGETLDIGPLKEGDKIAIIDAT